MKKILSMVLFVAFVMTTLVLPASVSADEWAVDITSVSEGDTFAAGSNIVLTADATALASVKNIDFYANGTKLPGTIEGDEGSIVWYDATVGSYEITTKVTFAGDENTVQGNETVNIAVLPDESEVTVIWPREGLRFGVGTESDEYTVYGTKSLEYIPTNGAMQLTCDVTRTWNRCAVVIYSPYLDNINCSVAAFYDNNQRSGAAGNYDTINKGVNHIITADASSRTALNKVILTFSNIPEGNDKPVYISGIIGMTNASRDLAAPVATPEIGNAATGICNAIGTYRINFDKPILPDDTKAPAVVSVSGGSEVEGVTYTYGFDYVDLHLPALELDTTYEVSIPADTILAYNTWWPIGVQTGAKFVAATNFTFTTKDSSCETATPIVKMSYPSAGTSCLSDTGFAAQVIAPSSSVSYAEFYNGETKLGDGVKMTGGEWWFKPSEALAAGDYTITAKLFNSSDEVVATTAAASYTVIVPHGYFVKGIGDGDYIVAAEESARKITVVDEDNASVLPINATDVEEVKFYNDDVLLATDAAAPYEYELVFDNYGTHTLKAEVYNIYGEIKTYEKTYTVLNASKNTTYSYDEDFSELTTENISSFYGTNSSTGAALVSGSNVTATVADGAMNFANTNTSAMRQFAFKYAPVNVGGSGAKVHYYEYDLTQSVKGAYTLIVGKSWGSNANTGDRLLYTGATATGDNISATLHKVGVVLDFYNNIAIVRLDGEEMKRVVLTNSGFGDSDSVIMHNQVSKSQNITIDNFKFAVYDTDTIVSFGTGSYVREYTGEALSGDSIEITTNAINTTNSAQSLVNIIAVYDSENKLLELPVVDTVNYGAGDFKTQTYNVSIDENAARVSVFTWQSLDSIIPIGLWG